MTTTVSERRGVHRILDLSWAYSLFQGGIVKPDSAARLRAELFPDLGATVTRVLDLGCGPATFLATHHDAGTFTYVGFDPNPKYIVTAKEQFPEAELHVGTTATLGSTITGTFDLAVAFGVLHHVPDAVVRELAAFAADRLEPGGRLVTIDPTLMDGQRTIARGIAKADRGKYVRSPEAYVGLLREGFGPGEVTSRTFHDLLRVPYDHCVTISTRA